MLIASATMLCAFNTNAQNLRRVEGAVKDYRGASISNATLYINGLDKTFMTQADGSFVIDVPIHCYAITVTADGYRAKFMEIDGTYMLFVLRPKTQKEIAWEERQVQLVKQKEVEEKAKAEEQARIAAQKEAEAEATAKAKAEEQARIATQKEAEARAKAEEQARIAAQKEAEAKAKAEEQARIAAQKEAEAEAKAKAKEEKQAKLTAEKAAEEQYKNWLKEQRAKQAEILEQRRAAEDYE